MYNYENVSRWKYEEKCELIKIRKIDHNINILYLLIENLYNISISN